jgi:2-polyprenyl-3-methyl-5-hydroxy-6-metoxy-1,4-benzoquinol methylase
MNDATARLYDEKERGYFSAARTDLLQMLPRGGGLRLLELGAGDGATLRAAKALGLASWVAGIDIVAPPAAAEGQPGIDLFLHGNVETLDPASLPGGLDAVLCADVLEHLVEPWRVVSLVAGLLKPGGVLLSSIPNVRNHRALRAIVLQGDFRYQPAGLLDRSHLRFFCRKNVRELFEQAGLVVEAMEENMGGYGLRHRLLDRLTFGRCHDFFVFQFRTLARKP